VGGVDVLDWLAAGQAGGDVVEEGLTALMGILEKDVYYLALILFPILASTLTGGKHDSQAGVVDLK
jgi:hypothetical protein